MFHWKAGMKQIHRKFGCQFPKTASSLFPIPRIHTEERLHVPGIDDAHVDLPEISEGRGWLKFEALT